MSYFVKYCSHGIETTTPFDSKNTAIKYFNHLCDRLFIESIDFDHIEITDADGCVLFDYEV